MFITDTFLLEGQRCGTICAQSVVGFIDRVLDSVHGSCPPLQWLILVTLVGLPKRHALPLMAEELRPIPYGFSQADHIQ